MDGLGYGICSPPKPQVWWNGNTWYSSHPSQPEVKWTPGFMSKVLRINISEDRKNSVWDQESIHKSTENELRKCIKTSLVSHAGQELFWGWTDCPSYWEGAIPPDRSMVMPWSKWWCEMLSTHLEAPGKLTRGRCVCVAFCFRLRLPWNMTEHDWTSLNIICTPKKGTGPKVRCFC